MTKKDFISDKNKQIQTKCRKHNCELFAIPAVKFCPECEDEYWNKEQDAMRKKARAKK